MLYDAADRSSLTKPVIAQLDKLLDSIITRYPCRG